MKEKQQQIEDSIVKKTLGAQQRGALLMQRCIGRLPNRFQKILFTLLFMGAGYFSCSLIYSGIKGKAVKTLTVRPIHFQKIEEEKNISSISEKEFRQIEDYKAQLTDSIKIARPGLLDSIAQIELIYHSTKK